MPARHGLAFVDPRRQRGTIFRLYARALGTTRPAMWFARNVLWKVDPHVLRLSRSRISLAIGLPRTLLETRGARTGQVRRNGVIYFHDGDQVIVIASKFGAPEHPAWFHNAVANPDVTLGGQPFRAGVVGGEAEQARLWKLADRVFPPFATYRERATRVGRAIPILRLVPQEPDGG